MGVVDYKDIPKIYLDYDIIVLPSKVESFGYTILEGLYFNKWILMRYEELVEIPKAFDYKKYLLMGNDLEKDLLFILDNFNKELKSSSSMPVPDVHKTYDFIIKTLK